MIETIKGGKLPLVGIVVVNSREFTNPDWFAECMDSVNNQSYPEYRICVIDNTKKDKTIGRCRNLAVKSLYDCKWILFVDDDDIITIDYLYSLVSFAETMDDVNWVSSYSTLFYENCSMHTAKLSPIGLWRTEYLLINPFSEILDRFEDVELTQRLQNKQQKKAILKWTYGYYYRQHEAQNSRVKKEKNITHENNSKLKRTALEDYEKVKNGEYITS